MRFTILSLALHFGLYSLVLSPAASHDQTAPVTFEVLTTTENRATAPAQKARKRSSAVQAPTLKYPASETEVHTAATGTEAGLQTSDAPLSLNELSGKSSAYSHLIHLIYQHRIYPQDCLRLRLQGQVTLSFFINSDGQIQNIEVVEASPHRLLNQAARATMKRVRLNDELQTLFNRRYTFTFEFVIKNLSS